MPAILKIAFIERKKSFFSPFVKPISLEEFRQLVESDIELEWREDVDDKFKIQQEKRLDEGKPNKIYRKCCVYKFRALSRNIIHMQLVYEEEENSVIAVVIHKDLDDSIRKAKEVAKKLRAKYVMV